MPPKKRTPTQGDKTNKIRKCSSCGIPETSKTPLVEVANEELCADCLNAYEFMLKDVQKQVDAARKANGTAPKKSAAAKTGNPAIDDFLAFMDDEGAPDSATPDDEAPKQRVPTPAEIKAFLDQYVVGQNTAKRVLAVAVHNHYKRIYGEYDTELLKAFDDVEIEKSNILLIGPTGSGKTLLARTLARMLDVPFAIADATTLTEAGYVGEDVENILLNLMQAADMDIERAQKGIIFVDEIDKIGRRTDNVSITRDVSGEGVQQALLKILEGTVARVPPAGGRKHPEQRYIELETKDILFICGGAFVGLDHIMKRRADKKHFGFSTDDTGSGKTARVAESRLRPEPEDLIQYGLIPEFVGRLPIATVLDELTEDDLVHILTEPKNCLVRQYKKLLAMEDIELQFEPDAIRAMAREALDRKTGARGLRAIMEELMIDVMYDIGSLAETKAGKIVITETMVRQQLAAPGTLIELLKA